MKLDAKNLKDDQLRLEVLSEEHRKTLGDSKAVDAMWDWLPMVEGGSGFENYFANTLKQKKDGHIIPFMVFSEKTDEFAGVAAFIGPNKIHRRVRIGYVWHPESMRGCGVFHRTQLLLLTRAYDWGARRIEWYVDTRNAAALRAIESLGTHRDGVMQDWQRLSDGSWSDVVVYSMLRSSWSSVREALVSRLEKHTNADAG